MATQGHVEYDDSVFKRKLGILLSKTSDKAGVLTAVAIEAQRDILRHFDKEEGPGNNAWKKSQRAIRQGGKTLQDTGRLRTIEFNIYPSRNAALIGTTVDYGRAHNVGANIPEKFLRPTKKKSLHWVFEGVDHFSYGHKIPAFRLPKREWAYISDEGSICMDKALNVMYKRYILSSGFKLI